MKLATFGHLLTNVKKNNLIKINLAIVIPKVLLVSKLI